MNSIPATRPGRGRTPDSGGSEAVEIGQPDPADFEEMYLRHYRGVYAYALARTHDEQDAADLAQQVFVQALSALPQYENQGAPFAAWLFRIARNLITDRHRRRRDTVPWESVPAGMQPAYDDDMEAAMERREAVDELRGMLARVDPEKQDLLALQFSGELKIGEIAHVLGRSEGAVKSELRRTLRALREAYDEE